MEHMSGTPLPDLHSQTGKLASLALTKATQERYSEQRSIRKAIPRAVATVAIPSA